MKRIFTLLIMIWGFAAGSRAATTYNITSNTSWSSASLPSYCSDCIFNISSGVTLTLNNSSQCANCTFSGGTIKITSGFSFNGATISNTTINASTSFNMWGNISLTNTTMNMTSGSVAPGALTATGSIFNFSGSSSLTLNSASTVTNSTFNFTNTSAFTANGALTANGSTFSFANSTSITVSGALTTSGSNFTFSNTSTLTTNSSVSATGSTMTFNNSSGFTANGQMNLDGSSLYLNGSSHLTEHSNINLKNGSKLVAGDGSVSSTAYLYVDGQVNLQTADAMVIISNKNNHFHSWNGFNNPSGHNYSTVVSSNPDYYGGAVLSSTGVLPITILPVTFSSFKGVQTAHNIRLSWSLSDISGNVTLELEHSTDAIRFSPIATMQANGSETDYAYTDASPADGENDYRVKSTDANGVVTYSKIISFTVKPAAVIRLFPNPCTNGDFNVRFPSVQSAMIRIFTAEGRLVYMASLSGQSQYAIHIPGNTGTGWLVVQLIYDGETNTFSLMTAAH